MFNYFKKSFSRKKARRVTKEYPVKVDSFELKDDGSVEFANWDNPLVNPKIVSQDMVDFFKQFVKHGDLVIDIGANIGDMTVPMALAAGKTGTTLAFDPNPYVFKVLEKNALLNAGKQHIVPLLYAITEKEESFYYVSSEASFSNGGISSTKKSSHGRFVYPDKIRGINLLEYLEKEYPAELGKLSFIKIDAEGYDKEIIKSIPALIQRYKPVIIAESFRDNTPQQKMELYDVIKQHGYDIFLFEDFNIHAKVIKLETNQDMLKWKTSIDIYALPSKA